MAPDVGSLTSRVTTYTSLRYFVPSWLKESARFVNEAITAKNVALRCAGAELAIHTSIGIIEIWPSGDSKAVSIKAMKRASTTPPVRRAVHSCSP